MSEREKNNDVYPQTKQVCDLRLIIKRSITLLKFCIF